jgi:hypothetical protein
MVARKQREIEKGRGQSIPFKVMPPVTYFFQLDLTS